MKRTLTILAISAAMIAFVACGKKSPQEVKPEASVVLPVGTYADKQEVTIFKVATTTDEDKATLAGLKKTKGLAEAELVSFVDQNGIDFHLDFQGKPETWSAIARDYTARVQAMDQLDLQIQEIEKKLIDFKINFMELSISKNNDGDYKVSKIEIHTDKDRLDIAYNSDGEVIRARRGPTKGQPVMFMADSKEIHKNIPNWISVFDGAELLDGGKINYHAPSGSLRFAMFHKGVKYTFNGRVENQGEGNAVISGNVELTCSSCDHVLQTERWSVALPAAALPSRSIKEELEKLEVAPEKEEALPTAAKLY